MRGGTAGGSGNGRLNSRQPGKEGAGAAEGRLRGARSGWSDSGRPTPQEPAVDTALQAHQSLRKDFTSAGDSSGPLNPFSLPLQRFPQGHVCALLAQVPAGQEDTWGGAPRVVQETGRQRADLAGGLALSLSRGPGGESSSPPPKLQRAKARGCLQGSREAEAPPCPSVLPVPQPWPLPICLALPGMATSGRHQGKHSQADPHLPAAQNKASVPRPNHTNTSHTEVCTTWPPGPRTWKVTHRLHQQRVRQKHSAGSLLIHTCAPHTCACTHSHTWPSLPLLHLGSPGVPTPPVKTGEPPGEPLLSPGRGW